MRNFTCFLAAVAALGMGASAGEVTPGRHAAAGGTPFHGYAVSVCPEIAHSPMEFMIGHRGRVEGVRGMGKTLEEVTPGRHAAAGGTPFHGLRSKRVMGHAEESKSEISTVQKAGTVRTFGWNGARWVPEDVYNYTYDTQGNVTEELAQDAEGDYAKTVNEYDANGKVTFKETTVSSNGLDFTNSRKIEFSYDPIMTNVITQRDEQVWLMESWKPGNCYKRIIKRDEAGNVTNITIAVLFNGEYDPTQRLTITYGEDGKATHISEQILNYDYGKGEYYWEQGIDITDITWDRTDGQIYDPEDLFLGNNRIKTAHYSDVDDMSMDISVEYADDNDGYTISMDGLLDGELVTAKTVYTPLENNGYILEGTTYYMGLPMWISREEYRYDEWGLMTYYEEMETEDDFTYGESSTGEVEYDEEGRPAVYTVSQTSIDWETGEEITEYVIRAEYSDYRDVASDVRAVHPYQASERCFDLNGVRVAEPSKGRIVITESGKKRVQ